MENKNQSNIGCIFPLADKMLLRRVDRRWSSSSFFQNNFESELTFCKWFLCFSNGRLPFVPLWLLFSDYTPNFCCSMDNNFFSEFKEHIGQHRVKVYQFLFPCFWNTKDTLLIFLNIMCGTYHRSWCTPTILCPFGCKFIMQIHRYSIFSWKQKLFQNQS